MGIFDFLNKPEEERVDYVTDPNAEVIDNTNMNTIATEPSVAEVEKEESDAEKLLKEYVQLKDISKKPTPEDVVLAEEAMKKVTTTPIVPTKETVSKTTPVKEEVKPSTTISTDADILAEIKKLTEERGEEKKSVDWMNAVQNIANLLAKQQGTATIAPFAKVDESKYKTGIDTLLKQYKAGKSGGKLVEYFDPKLQKNVKRFVTPEEMKSTTFESPKKAGESAFSANPDDAASKAAQKQAVSLMDSLGIIYDKDNIEKLSEKTLNSKNFTAGLRKTANKLSKERLDSTNAERSRKWINDNQEDLKKQITAFNKDKTVEKAKMMVTQAEVVQELVNSDNPIGHNAIPTFLARASGEVGNLSEPDKIPFGSGGAISTRVKQIAKDYAKGLLTDENRKYVNDLLAAFKRSSDRILDNKATEAASQFGDIDFPMDVLKNRFLATPLEVTNPEISSKTEKLDTKQKDANIEKYAKANNLDYNMAEKILRGRGYGR